MESFSKLMIDAISFRIRVGHHNARTLTQSTSPNQCHDSKHFRFLFSFFTYAIFIFYILLFQTTLLSDSDWTPQINTVYLHYPHLKQPYSDHTPNLFSLFPLLINGVRIVLSHLVKTHGELNLKKLYIHIRYRYRTPENKAYTTFRRFLVWLSVSNLILLINCNVTITNPGPNKGLSVVYQNVQGLIPFSELGNDIPKLHESKINELKTYAYMHKPDVIILNETWLKPSINDNEIFPPEAYKIFRCDRSPKSHPPDPQNPNRFRKNGGGVLIAINSSLDINSKIININCSAELLSVQITLKNKTKFYLSTLYRVGTLGIDNFNSIKDYYHTLLKKRNASKIYTIGDINFPELENTNWESNQSNNQLEQKFLGLFNDLGLKQCINSPTHRKGNILDVVLTNSPHTVNDLNVLDDSSVCSSDHFPISFNVTANIRRRRSCKRVIQNLKKADWHTLNNDLQNTDWHSLLCSSDVEQCWKIFRERFDDLCTKSIPKITVKNGFQPPWFDSEVFDKCREKERHRADLKKCKKERLSQENLTGEPQSPCPKEISLEIKFQSTRRQVNQLIRSKMRSNFSDDHSENTISKKFWSYVKATSNSHRIPESIYYNDQHRTNHEDQANLFNTFFYEQFSSPSNYAIDINYNLNFDIHIDEHIVYPILKHLDPNKASGPDKIHGTVLKKCAKSLAIPLSILFRTSYYTCKIPRDWKSANIVPVFKKGCKNNACNYRPISLTSLVMKVYERVIKAELLPRVIDKIDTRQHGFLPSKSCETQLIPYCDMLARNLNKGSRTDVIYFDFAKAFDSVNHDIILQKLKHKFGIDGLLLKFFVEYLSNRCQRVVVNGSSSNDLPVNSGVPQGSILGPVLFVLFINDISSNIDPKSDICLYADDTKLYREIVTIQDQAILQQDISKLNDWATSNKMKFHPDKCKLLSVTLNRENGQTSSYKLGNKVINQVEVEKDLGVHISSRLNWTDHCNYIYSKANRNLGLMKRTCRFVKNRAQRRNLYLAMVRSQLEHCSTVWSPYTTTSLDKLESIQKRAFKWIFGEEYCSYSPELYYLRCKELNILPIKHKLLLKDLKLFHEIIINKAQIDFPDYLKMYSGSTRLRSSHLDELSVVSNIEPKITRNYNGPEIVSTSLAQFANCYFYRTMNNWNLLPKEVREHGLPKQFEFAASKWLWEAARPQTE